MGLVDNLKIEEMLKVRGQLVCEWGLTVSRTSFKIRKKVVGGEEISMAISEGTEVQHYAHCSSSKQEANRLKDFRPLLKACVTLSTSFSQKS